MKKLLTVLIVFSITLIFAQKNKNYQAICYSSICCGTPSRQPVMDYIQKFQKNNHLKKFEIWIETGLGKEGENCVYVGLDPLNKIKRTKFLTGLKKILIQQNEFKKRDSDGAVNMSENFTSGKELLNQQKNPRTTISTLTRYKNK